MASADKQYWRKKLPPGFQRCMENLGRSIICNKPENILEYAAWYLEKKLNERNAALKNLPNVSYLQKLKQKRFGNKPSRATRRSISKDDAEGELIVKIEETNIMAASAHTLPVTKSETKHSRAKSVEEFVSLTLQGTTSDKSGADTPVEVTNTTAKTLQTNHDKLTNDALRLATGENSESMGQEDAHESHEHTLLIESDKHSESEQGLNESQTTGENEAALGDSKERMLEKPRAETPESQEATDQHHGENKIEEAEALEVKEECDSEPAVIVSGRIHIDDGNQGAHKQAAETCTDNKEKASGEHGESDVERVEDTANIGNGQEITEQQSKEKQIQEADDAVTEDAKQHMEREDVKSTSEGSAEMGESKQQSEESDIIKGKQAETVTAADKETTDETSDSSKATMGNTETSQENDQTEGASGINTSDEEHKQTANDTLMDADDSKESPDDSKQHAEESMQHSEEPEVESAVDEQAKQTSESKEHIGGSDMHKVEPVEGVTTDTTQEGFAATEDSKEVPDISEHEKADKETANNAELVGVADETMGETETSGGNTQTENSSEIVPSKVDETKPVNDATVEDSRESVHDSQHAEEPAKDKDGQETDSTKEEPVTQTNDEPTQQAEDSGEDELKETKSSEKTDTWSGTEKPETTKETAGNTEASGENKTELSGKAVETSKQMEEASGINAFKEEVNEERSGSPEKEDVKPEGSVKVPVESKGETEAETAEIPETETPEKTSQDNPTKVESPPKENSTMNVGENP